MNRIRNRKCIGKRIRIGKKIGNELWSAEEIELVKELAKELEKYLEEERDKEKIRKRNRKQTYKRIRNGKRGWEKEKIKK